MRPFPALRISNENPGAGAQKWRIREIVDQGGGDLGASEVMFLAVPGAVAQPGTGTPLGTTPAAGSVAAAFDGNPATEYAGAYASDGSTYLEFDFNLVWDIKELYYQNRASGSWVDQAPRHLRVEKFFGGAWVTAADLFGIPFWAAGEARRFAITGYTDDVGSNAHRYWRLTNLTPYSGGGGTVAEIELELLDATATNVTPVFDKWIGTANYAYARNMTDGVKTGDNYFVVNSGETIAFDFFKKRDIRQVRLTARSTLLTQAVKSGRLEWSDDGSTWTEYMTFDNTSPWTVFSGVSISGGVASVSGGAQMLQQNLGLVTGSTYNFSFDYNKTAGSKLRIENGASSGANITYTSAVLANGAANLASSFVAAGPYFGIAADTATYSGTFDNAIVTLQGGDGTNLISDGTFSKPTASPTSNETRTFSKGKPVNTVAGSVAGIITSYGNTLTLNIGTWINAPTSYTIQWLKDGVAIAGANGLTYNTVAGDLNHTITVTIIAHNDIGDSATSTVTAGYIGVPGSTAFDWTDPNVLTAHRYWRLLWGSTQSGTLATIAELYFRDTAAALITGTWTGWNNTNGAPSSLADGNPATFWGDGGSSSGLDRWVALDLGAGNAKIVKTVEMTPRTSFQSQTPIDFYLQYSDDAATWTNATRFRQCDFWGSGVRKIFDVRPYIVQFYWDSPLNGSFTCVAECEVLNGSGTDLTTPTPANDNDRGRPFGTSDGSGPYNAFNDVLSDYTGNAGNPSFTEWRFTGTPDCFGVSVRGRSGFSSQAPSAFKVRCSRDGINYNLVFQSPTGLSFASNERKAYSF